jgi:competence ComEA-like helix-hairpin-helix protein
MMDLTKQERQVIVFLLAVSLSGIAVEFLAKRVPPLSRRNCLDNLGKIDLNKADKDTLEIIPGIGEKLAQRIIEYREENDGFSALEDVAKVKGVKPRLTDKLKDCAFVR